MPMTGVTQILEQIETGDPAAAEQLLPLVYEELRKLAAQKMAQESPDQTLQATAVVHEAYIRLMDVEKAQRWDSRGHFCRCDGGHAADSDRSDTTEAKPRQNFADDTGAGHVGTAPPGGLRTWGFRIDYGD